MGEVSLMLFGTCGFIPPFLQTDLNHCWVHSLIAVVQIQTLFFQSKFYSTVTDHKLCSDMASLTLIRSRDLHWVKYFTLCHSVSMPYTLQN